VQEIIEILLVDDEPRNLDALEAILTDPGYCLLRADGADRALRLLLDHDVAAIVLDIKMPGVSGFELAQMIKGSRRFRQIPIVFLTAHMVEDQDVIAGYGAGAVDYLTKPLNPQILRHKIAVFADLFRKTRALAELNEKLEARVQERTAELQASEEALREGARQKDIFLATLAHELRNPLAPLRMGLDLLLRVEKPAPAVGRTLAAMNRQLDHMVRLVDDLLDVSRISRGMLELKKERADLRTLVEQSIETSRPFFAQRHQSIAITDIVNATALVDPTRVSQILGNLLHNASKYMPENGVVKVSLTIEGSIAAIRVLDSGVGLEGGEIERVFDMFAKIDRLLPSSSGGLGIGLALARRLAEMHGGTLIASSEGVGRGSTFTLSLPLTSADAASPGEAASKASSDGPASLNVLVIEDNDDVADTLALWLEQGGHAVEIARTGSRGLELVETRRPSVILCDLGLPEMDGIEVCRRIRELRLGYRPLLVALTGWGQEEDRRRTREAGFDHHLVKPVAPEKLREILRSADVS
jgi:DNA-binding response OmpR family regulator